MLVRQTHDVLSEGDLVPVRGATRKATGCPVLRALEEHPDLTPSEITKVVKDLSIKTIERRLKTYRATRQVTRDAGRYRLGPVRELQGAVA
jgi:hypothetical protein